VPVYPVREQTIKGSEWPYWQRSELWPRDSLQSPAFFVLREPQQPVHTRTMWLTARPIL